jgi:flagellar hook-basal body complex protein FliE
MATNAFAAGAYAAIQGLAGPGPAKKPAAAAGAAGGEFGSLLQGAVDAFAQSGKKAETQAMAVATGKADVVDVVTAVAESEAALETLVAVRDRVIAAYEEIMRMPI